MVMEDHNGLGADYIVPNNIVIGKYVMMAPRCFIADNNHVSDRIDVPMCFQGKTEHKVTIIEDNVWIGTGAIMTLGHRIGKGSIIAAGTAATKDVAKYSVAGGNPVKIIRMRKSMKEVDNQNKLYYV